jgi:hypothetical protein
MSRPRSVFRLIWRKMAQDYSNLVCSSRMKDVDFRQCTKRHAGSGCTIPGKQRPLPFIEQVIAYYQKAPAVQDGYCTRFHTRLPCGLAFKDSVHLVMCMTIVATTGA